MDWKEDLVLTKDPDSVLDYQFDWSDWLVADTISSASMTVTTGLTLDSESNDTTTHTAWLSGGTAGTDYTMTSRIVTAAGRTVDRSVTIHIAER